MKDYYFGKFEKKNNNKKCLKESVIKSIKK